VSFRIQKARPQIPNTEPGLCPFSAHHPFSNTPQLGSEESCDEFPGRRESYFVNLSASDAIMDSARAGVLKLDWRR